MTDEQFKEKMESATDREVDSLFLGAQAQVIELMVEIVIQIKEISRHLENISNRLNK